MWEHIREGKLTPCPNHRITNSTVQGLIHYHLPLYENKKVGKRLTHSFDGTPPESTGLWLLSEMGYCSFLDFGSQIVESFLVREVVGVLTRTFVWERTGSEPYRRPNRLWNYHRTPIGPTSSGSIRWTLTTGCFGAPILYEQQNQVFQNPINNTSFYSIRVRVSFPFHKEKSSRFHKEKGSWRRN